jgi:hypothetical protein
MKPSTHRQSLDLGQREWRPVREHQSPACRSDAQERAACGATPAAALVLGDVQWCESNGLARGHAGAEYDAWLINIREGDQFGSGSWA